MRKKKKIKKILKTIILLAIIIGGICFAVVSPIFNVTDIKVTGNNKINSDTIVSLSQIQTGQNIFRFNKNKVIKEIKCRKCKNKKKNSKQNRNYNRRKRTKL